VISSLKAAVHTATNEYHAALEKRTSLFNAELVPIFHQLRGTEEGSVFFQNALQVVIDERDKEAQKMLASQLEGRVVDIAKSPYDNFFLQACINSLPIPAIKFVLNELLEDTELTVAKNQQGVRVLCRLIEQCCESRVDAEVDEAATRLFNRILESTKPLACHKYGQYVLKAMCENGRGQWPIKVIERLLALPSGQAVDGVVRVASHHYGCWVVQSALEFRPKTDEECGKVIQLRSRVFDVNQPGQRDRSQLKKKDKYSWISKMFRKEWECCTYLDGGRSFLVHNKSSEAFCLNPRCRRECPTQASARSSFASRVPSEASDSSALSAP
jgi:hypothetical protein